jgi:hypothetical protein
MFQERLNYSRWFYLPLFIVWCVSLLQTANAEEEKTLWNKTTDAASEASKKVSETLDQTRISRGESKAYLLGSYSMIDLLIPSKIGFTVGFINSAEKTWEVEFLRGSLAIPFLVRDIGKMSDTKLSLLIRSYGQRNSFHLVYGLAYYDFSVRLGDELLSRVSSQIPSMELIEIKALGAHFGIGNRWTFGKSFTVGVDWVAWSQPLIVLSKKTDILNYATDQNDKDNINAAVNLISSFPRWTAMKFQMGFLF